MNYEDIDEYYQEQEKKNTELCDCLIYLIIGELLFIAGWILWDLIK